MNPSGKERDRASCIPKTKPMIVPTAAGNLLVGIIRDIRRIAQRTTTHHGTHLDCLESCQLEVAATENDHVAKPTLVNVGRAVSAVADCAGRRRHDCYV